MNLLSPARLAALAAAAVAAPSADNRHVFRLETRDDTLRLLARPELLEAAASRRVLGLVSVGAAAENLALRGTRLGLRLEPRWALGIGLDPALLVEFACTEVAPSIDPLDSAIESRHSNRRLHFRGPRLTAEEQTRLGSEADDIPGSELVWLDAPALRRRALRLVRSAETERFRNEELHRELFESIRFDVGWHASATEGLPPGSLELPWIERPGFAMLRQWKVQRVANAVGVHRFIGFRAADLPCRLAPHLCAVTAEGDVATAAVAAGRLLQRVWLRATTLGVAFQVFAAAPLYALEGASAVAPDLQRALAEGWQELCPSGRPLVVVRLGHAKGPSWRAGRPPAASLLAP